MDIFFDSHHFKEKLNPIPHAYESLLKLKKNFELHIVTSRQYKVEPETIIWINKHFPDIFTAIHLGNHYSNEGKSRTKSEICHSIGAVLLIDDSVKYTVQCVRDSVPVILFGSYAWNQIEADFSDITFKEYSPEMVIDTENSMMRHSTAGSESSTTDSTAVVASRPKVVYRVCNWLQVIHLIYATFGIPQDEEEAAAK